MQDIVVLFIHGFMGHPKEYQIMKEIVEKLQIDTYLFTLTGHNGGKIKNVTRKDWENDCINNIELLINKGYKKIIIVGHSMGGVLATTLALKYKDFVSKLILIDPAFEYLKMKDGKLKIFPSMKQIIKIIKDNKNKSHSSQIFRCSLSSLKEFCSLIKEHGKDIYNVECPILILHGENDTIVPLDQMQNIYEKIINENKNLLVVPGGSHWFLHSKFEDEINEEIKKFILNNK